MTLVKKDAGSRNVGTSFGIYFSLTCIIPFGTPVK